MIAFDRDLLFQGAIFRFHVKLQGCNISFSVLFCGVPVPLAALATPPSHTWDRVAHAPPRVCKSCSLAKTETQKLSSKTCMQIICPKRNCGSASQSLKGNAWQAGSWISLVEYKASPRRPTVTDISLFPSTKEALQCKTKIKTS